jgi:hypothetical protein
MHNAAQIFTPAYLATIFPPEKTDEFFAALFGDAEEGAYTISLRFEQASPTELRFAFDLEERPGMCLACNLTYGLPQVFSRHPVLAVGNIAETLAHKAGWPSASWSLLPTQQVSKKIHSIPLVIQP